MPKIVDAAEQRARIRGAARRVFSRRGLAGVGLAHVAREAGVSRSNLYHYYEDKAALVRDLASELLEEEEALFREALLEPGAGGTLERIELLSARIVERFATWAEVGGALLEIFVEERQRVRTLLRGLRADLGEILRQGQQAGEIDAALDPAATAMLLVGVIDGLLLQVFLDPKAIPASEAVNRALVDLLHRALAPSLRTSPTRGTKETT